MTAPERWVPGDDELDSVARSIEPAEPVAGRVEHDRTAILAAAAGRKQLPRHSRAPIVAIGIALAAAAAVVMWIRTRPEPTGSQDVVAEPAKQIITPIGVARFKRLTDWPDFVVRADDGTLDIQVAKLDSGERFRVKTADAEVEVRGTRFEVGVRAGHLLSVAVREGRVEIRRLDQQVVIVSAGESWAPPQTAQRDELVPVPADPVVTVTRATPPSKPAPSPAPRSTPRSQLRPPTADPAPRPPSGEQSSTTPAPAIDRSTAPAAAVAASVRPGEAEFRAGMASLRTGDAGAAAASFVAACTKGHAEALGEDACFWSGAAARRAGDTAAARVALQAFLDDFPRSARAPEAAALLGWILYDAGDLSGAETMFHRAENDRVPKVRDSAARGLTAIERKRKTP